MGFIDKIKSKLKSAGTDELLASVPGVKKQAKEFKADQATLGAAAQAALDDCRKYFSKMNKGGYDDLAANRRDYELAVGQAERYGVDYKKFNDAHLAFIVSMLDVSETLEKQAKKEKDPKKQKALKDAAKELGDKFTSHSARYGTGHADELAKAVKAEKANIEAVLKSMNKLNDALDNIINTIINDCKNATRYFNDIEKLAAEIEKRCDFYDVKNAQILLTNLEDRKGRHDEFKRLREVYLKKLEKAVAASAVSTWDEKEGVKVLIPPRLNQIYMNALGTYDIEAHAIAKLLKTAQKQVLLTRTA